MAWLRARRRGGSGRLGVAIAVGTILQAPLGAITVYFHLNPWLVMTHFLVSIATLAFGVVLVLDLWPERPRPARSRSSSPLTGFAVAGGGARSSSSRGRSRRPSGPHPGNIREDRPAREADDRRSRPRGRHRDLHRARRLRRSWRCSRSGASTRRALPHAAAPARGARRAGDPRARPVPRAPAVVARAHPRRSRDRALDGQRRPRGHALARDRLAQTPRRLSLMSEELRISSLPRLRRPILADGVPRLERRRPGRDARSRLPREVVGRRPLRATSTPRASSTSRRPGRTSRSSTARRASSTGPTTPSSTRRSRAPTATACSSSGRSRTCAGAPSAAW